MINWKNKLKIIWKILFLKRNSIDINISELIEGYKIIDELNPSLCDNHFDFRTGCTNDAEHCLSRTLLHIEVKLSTADHVHVCESCANKLLGETHDFR